MTGFKAIAIKSHKYHTPEQLKVRDKLIKQNKDIMRRYNEEKTAKEKLERDNEEKAAKEKLASEQEIKDKPAKEKKQKPPVKSDKDITQKPAKGMKNASTRAALKSEQEQKKRNQKRKEVGSDGDFEMGEGYTTPDLGKTLVRRVLRTTYCARIVISDVNIKKDEMRGKMIEFCKKKPWLMELAAELGRNKKNKKS